MSIGKIVTLKNYEKEIFRLRRHLITFLPAFLLYVLGLILPVAAGIYFYITLGTEFTGAVYTPILILIAGVYMLSISLFFYSYFVDFYLDIFFVTNDRLVDVNQNNLFARTVSEVDLYRIQDITSEIKGISQQLFNYGTIIIQTAATEPKFVVYKVPDPHGLRQKLLDLAEADRQYHQK
ncbi:MAG TPA: PH domain-containing protein [Candidatus Magasanikbacteria bacterium]|nr:PH domain-containing protein [Candidatus Magasanikbacteria bacterium]